MKLNQYSMPLMGFGTYGRRGEEGVQAMRLALEIGYRHLDTAQDYDTEHEVGAAMKSSGLARNEVFVTTKIATGNYAKGKVVPSLKRSCDQLQVDQIDLTLLHWPSPNEEVPLEVYVEQIAEAQALGLTRLIGVSNFTIALLKQAQGILGETKIVNNQVELNPHMQNKTLATYCSSNDISVTCYLPIARGTLGGDPVLEAIAARHEASVEQIALAFEFAKGYCAIPTSGKAERIKSNFAATWISLSADEIAEIESADRGHRVIDPAWGPKWD